MLLGVIMILNFLGELCSFGAAVKYVQFESECENSIQFTLQYDRYNTILLQTHFMTYPRQRLNLKESEEINI